MNTHSRHRGWKRSIWMMTSVVVILLLSFGWLQIANAEEHNPLRSSAMNAILSDPSQAMLSPDILIGVYTSTTIIRNDSPDPSMVNASYNVAIRVTGTHGYPTGTVNITDGSASCTATLSLGMGSCSLTSTTLGNKTLTATYSGSFTYKPSSDTEPHTVKAPSTTTITSDTPDPSMVNTSYSISVTVSSSYGTPTGHVDITDGSTICTATLTAGSGSCSLTQAIIEDYTLTATYSGNTTYFSSSDTELHKVRAPSTTTITSDSPDPSVLNQEYTVTITVSGSYGIPTGRVDIAQGGASNYAYLTDGSGIRTLTTYFTGDETLQATYQGDSVYASSSDTELHTVIPDTTVQILVVDDGFYPDYMGADYYTDALDALGRTYNVWRTGAYWPEPESDILSLYEIIIWFSGDDDSYSAGPQNPSLLTTWLDEGGCFLLSSGGYLEAEGLTTFAATYLGVGAFSSDVEQTSVTGLGSVFSGLGPYLLSYTSHTSIASISPDATAEVAFSGDAGDAGVTKTNGIYRTVFLGFPLEAIPALADRQQVIERFLNSCEATSNTLIVNKLGDGTTISEPAGIDCGADCAEVYPPDTVVRLTATPSSGSFFTGWSGACGGIGYCWVTMSESRSVTATFTPIPAGTYPLRVLKGGTGSGTVTSSPAGIDCGPDCWEFYATDTVVRLTATALPGSSFSNWSGACGGTSFDCWVTMSQARSVTATFTLAPPPSTYSLMVTSAGAGKGTVTSTPAGIDCGSDCTEMYNPGTVVKLAAAASPGSLFTGWSGACGGSSVYCWVTMSKAKSVTATFTLIPAGTFPLTVIRAGTGSGTVTSTPTGISCGVDCWEFYTTDMVVKLTASAAPGSTFTGWGGACGNPTLNCWVTMTKAKSVTATFSPSGAWFPPDSLFPPWAGWDSLLSVVYAHHE